MKNKGAILIIIVIASIFFSLIFDNILIKDISYLRNAIFDDFFLGITFVSSEIMFSFILTSFFLWTEKKRKWIIPLWASLAVSVIVAFILKVTVQRPRPFQLGIVPLIPILQEASFSTWNFSFPSFQSMLAFCAVPILSKEFPRLKKFWIIFAVLVAFSRVYFGVHFVSDVISGGLIGYVIGLLVMNIEKENRWGEKIYNKIFRK